MFGLFHAPRRYPSSYQAYYDAFNFYEGRDQWLRSLEGIPPEAVALYSVHWCELEVANGGFWQFFFNSTGTIYPEASAGFRAIGLPEVAAVLDEAAAKLGNPFPGDQMSRRDIVGGPEARMDFSALDRRFWDLASADTFFRAKPKFVPFADAYADKWQRG